jgi:uncharacterized protein (DUF427 family)
VKGEAFSKIIRFGYIPVADFQAPQLPPLYGARIFHHDPQHWVHVVESPKRVRVVFGRETIADSKRVLLLREARALPIYYFPPNDVRSDLLIPSDHRTICPYKGEARYWSLKVGERLATDSVWTYPQPAAECAELGGFFSCEWRKMDAWYEEEEEVFVHARDPFKRIDVLQSSRHVQVIAAGETIADTRRPKLLLEPGHPIRYYIPREDVRTELLEQSATSTRCPYKGIASYWSARVGDQVLKDLVWSYQDTTPECPKIKDLLCLFNERVDAIDVDGERTAKPVTKWSRETNK